MKFSYITPPENALQVPFRFLSTLIVRLIARTPISPNQVTMLRGAVVLVGLWGMASGRPGYVSLGAVLFYVFEVLDHVDGDLARHTNRRSRLGPLMEQFQDTIFARPSNLLGAALVLGAYRATGSLMPAAMFAVCAYGRMNWMEFRDYFGWQRNIEKKSSGYQAILGSGSFKQTLFAAARIAYIWNNTLLLVPALLLGVVPPELGWPLMHLGFLAVALLNNLPWLLIVFTGFRRAAREDAEARRQAPAVRDSDISHD